RLQSGSRRLRHGRADDRRHRQAAGGGADGSRSTRYARCSVCHGSEGIGRMAFRDEPACEGSKFWCQATPLSPASGERGRGGGGGGGSAFPAERTKFRVGFCPPSPLTPLPPKPGGEGKWQSSCLLSKM